MATIIDIPNAQTLQTLLPERKFFSLVVLIAVWSGVNAVRLRRQSDAWTILSQHDGQWEEFLAPIGGSSTVPGMLHSMLRKPGLLGWLGLVAPSDRFSLRLNAGTLDCRVSQDGADYLVSIQSRGVPATEAGELVGSFRQSLPEDND